MGKLDNRVAVITGAGSGIGRGIALRFAEEGAIIVGVGQNKDKLDALETEIGDRDRVMCLSRDMADADAIQDVVDTCRKRFGRLDILVNNAAAPSDFGKRIHESSVERWDHIMSVNLRGYYLTMRAALPHMLTQGGGNILNVSSIAGLEGAAPATVCAYGVTKSGIIQLTRTAALEYCRDNIRVNCLCPGTVVTERTAAVPPDYLQNVRDKIPMHRFGTSGEMGNMALFLASGDSSFTTGSVYVSDGGFLAGKNI